VRGTRRTISPKDGVADRGAKAGRDGRTCGKREEGARRLLKRGGRGGEREKGRRMGGSGRGVPHGAGAAWGLAQTSRRRPTTSRPTVTRAQRARAARLCFGQGRAEAVEGGARWEWEGEERHERHAWAGPRRKKGWSSLDEQYGFEFI
jgi:hypothetical protein